MPFITELPERGSISLWSVSTLELTPARFAAYVRDEIAFWEPEVRGLGIKAE